MNFASRPHIGIASGEMFPSEVNDMNSILPPAARSNWNVADTDLRPMPSLHPPIDRRCAVFIGDSSPSVVAARISDCLRRRSIVVEYNDGMATASAVTIDRVHFNVRLYRGGVSGSPFSDGVIVEVTRTRGDPMTFHRVCRAILSSAQGDTDGLDYINPLIPFSGFDFVPTLATENGDSKKNAGDTQVLNGLELAWTLLKKDRIDANVIGMESIVFLTEDRSGGDGFTIAAQAVLGEPIRNTAEEEGDVRFAQVHQSIISLVRDRRIMGADAQVDEDNTEENEVSDGFGESGIASSATIRRSASQQQEDVEHLATMRTLAFRALGNSLEITSEHNGGMLLDTIIPRLLRADIIPALLIEIEDTIIPDSQAVNAHDAAIAARILRILVSNSTDAMRIALSNNGSSILEKATLIGSGRHAALENEANLAFEALSNHNNAAASPFASATPN